jgi:hypothetical protein
LHLKHMSSFTTILLRFCTWNMFSFTTILFCAFAPETYVQVHNYSSLRVCTWNLYSMCFSAWNIYPVSQLSFGNLRFSNYLSILSMLSPLFCITTMFHPFVSSFVCFLLFSFPSFRPFQLFFVLSLGATLLPFLLLVSTIYRASNVRPAVSAVRFRLSLDGPTGCQFRRQETSVHVSTRWSWGYWRFAEWSCRNVPSHKTPFLVVQRYSPQNTWSPKESHRYLDESSRDSSVGIETGYKMDGAGSIPGRDKRFFSTPQRPNQLRARPVYL